MSWERISKCDAVALMRGILLDIEGTTTPITFVYDVLFPYVRARLDSPIPSDIAEALRSEHILDTEAPSWKGPAPYVVWLMERDRKSTALKELQGRIWLQGYTNGELHGEVFSDVAGALDRWHQNDIDVRIFSSGSVLAQRLLFASTDTGDLTQYIRGYFDTTTGPKSDPASYRRIAQSFGFVAEDILFVSDVSSELDAARSAGMDTALCIRPGNRPQPPGTHRVINRLDQIAI
jgi:enolase-phosphatase E1